MSPILETTRQHVIRAPVLIRSDVEYSALCLCLIETLHLHFDRLVQIRHCFDLDLYLPRGGFSESQLRRLFLVLNSSLGGAGFVSLYNFIAP